jgi:hypothetical protein
VREVGVGNVLGDRYAGSLGLDDGAVMFLILAPHAPASTGSSCGSRETEPWPGKRLTVLGGARSPMSMMRGHKTRRMGHDGLRIASI